MFDYQFLGAVALVLAVVTRGSIVPVVVVTAFIAALMFLYEAAARRYRCRHPVTPASGSPAPSDTELTRWMSEIDRVLRSTD
ncbi:MAG: hypothetical protein LC792_11980 [Actinobacteria bacterium]|nr:hypothetical protein [Actinomycetota bacterium]